MPEEISHDLSDQQPQPDVGEHVEQVARAVGGVTVAREADYFNSLAGPEQIPCGD